MKRVAAIGEVLIDFLERDRSERGYPILEGQPGGAPANFLAAAARCGVETAMIAKVGADAFGRLLVESLEREGVDIRGVKMDDRRFTTLAFVTLGRGGERDFSFARKPGADTCLTWEEVDRALIDGADALHFGTLSLTQEPVREATRQAVAYARERGKLISFDPNLRLPLWDTEEEARRQILWGLEQADVVKLSGEEAAFALDCGPEEGGRLLLDRFGCRLAFVTLGRDGCCFASRRGCGHVAGFPVRAVDATGAGDIFGGSALARLLLSGKEPEDLSMEELTGIVTYANGAAALSTLRHGGLGTAPEPAEVDALTRGAPRADRRGL